MLEFSILTAVCSIRYPNIATAAVAGSAPVLALLNFEGYDQMVASVAGTPLLCLRVRARGDV